jgi:hypothetical protein
MFVSNDSALYQYSSKEIFPKILGPDTILYVINKATCISPSITIIIYKQQRAKPQIKEIA